MRDVPVAPSAASLPDKRPRSRRGGPHNVAFSLLVEVVTPTLGGGTQPREVDDVDIIRVPTVRGHLRFWWRALHGHEYAISRELFEAESRLWGRASSEAGNGRSQVEVLIEIDRPVSRDEGEIHPQKTPGAYALWPARSEKKRGEGPAPRYAPGTRFRLHVVVPGAYEADVRRTVRAWLLFGGYGSRTRRGLGGFTVVGNADDWLPTAATRPELERLFGRDIFSGPRRNPTDTPSVAGASLQVGHPVTDAIAAWKTALDWLKEFRQGTGGNPGDRAREPGTGKRQPQRPSVSNWPEADKVRHLMNKTKGHPPCHNATPAWPRAGFGLPIIGRFQKQGRDESRYDEPDGFELRWRSGRADQEDIYEEHDRLASPLIVKALPLANGTFVPCALWLNRAHPDGEVFLRGVYHSGAPFDLLVAPGDTPRFAVLAGKASLREAFLDWLQRTYGTTVIAP